MKLKLDLHVHTSRSPDAFTDPSALIEAAHSRGLDGVAVTDHNLTCSFASNEIIVVPGIEVTSSHGHILGHGARQPILSGLSPEHTIELMRSLGYITVVAHPFDWLGKGIDPRQLKQKPDAIETTNANAFPFKTSRMRAEQVALSLNLPMVGGSDSHLPQTIGDAYTEIEVDESTVKAILMSISSGRTVPKGYGTTTANKLRKLAHHLVPRSH